LGTFGAVCALSLLCNWLWVFSMVPITLWISDMLAIMGDVTPQMGFSPGWIIAVVLVFPVA